MLFAFSCRSSSATAGASKTHLPFDSTITSAVLDRLLHHAETVLIEGSSYRMKDRIEP